MKYDLQNLFDLSKTIARGIFTKYAPHDVPAAVGDYIISLSETLGDNFVRAGDGVFIHKSATVAPSAYIGGPCIIDEGAIVRHCAFIRGGAIIGKGAVVGNSTEIKNAILFDGAQAPHFNYVGDSVMGYRAHLGAGAITSNLKSDGSDVVLKFSPPVTTGKRKLGALVGDFAEIGCGAVLCPGTVVGRRTTVYPLSVVRGVLPEDIIYKEKGVVVKKESRP